MYLIRPFFSTNHFISYYLGEDNYLSRITKKAATVEEAIRIARLYHFGENLIGQYHIADASGDAVVISGGADGKIAFTRIDPGADYLLTTNFNLAQPEKGPKDFRWETASKNLKDLSSGQNLTPEFALKILEEVHLETLTSYTLYSNVLNLKENLIYLNYMGQFNETAVIDIQEEFTKGQRVVDMREFFSPETKAAGDSAYQSFAKRFLLAKIGFVSSLVFLLIGISAFIRTRVIAKRR